MLVLKQVRLKREASLIIEDISLELAPGQTVAVLGPSGCGKTTLLQLVAGLLPATGGVVANGFEKLSYMFQEDRLLPWSTVYENIALVQKKPQKEQILALLAAVGLKGYENNLPTSLSGGMKQRCALVRTLCYDAPLILLDEPFRSLDIGNRQQLLGLLLRRQQDVGNALLVVTHDMEEALLLADTILVLSPGPARVLERFEISIPKANRNLDDSNMQELKHRLAGTLKQQMGENT